MEKKTNAEQVLQTHLREGEQVRWHGRTEDFPLLGRDAKWLILSKWIGTAVVAGTFVIMYLLNNTEDGNMKMVTVVILMACWLISTPVLERRNLLQQQYWITDQRAILMTKNQTFYAMNLSDIDDMQVVSGKTEYDCLVLGSCLFEEINRQIRWRSCHPKAESQSEGKTECAVGMIFYNVMDLQEALACLRQEQGTRT